KLRLRLNGAERQQLAKRPTINPEAYDLYLQGLSFENKATEDDYVKAIDRFLQAVNKDPDYARAYVGLADTYILLGTDMMSPKQTMPDAKRYASKALELDGTLREAHAAMGIIHLVYDWDWQGAADEFGENLPLNPQSVESFSCALHYLDALGRNAEAI